MNVRALTEADAETNSAYEWYQQHSITIAEEFLLDLIETKKQVGEHPLRFPRINARGPLELGRKHVGRFPYSVIYAVMDSDCVVVAHACQRPNYWRRRVVR